MCPPVRRLSVERGVELRGVALEPAAPGHVVRDARLEERPELGPMAEDAHVAHLVGRDRVEHGGRGQDQPP